MNAILYGAAAGYRTVIYPIDMIKSRMQTDGFSPSTGQRHRRLHALTWPYHYPFALHDRCHLPRVCGKPSAVLMVDFRGRIRPASREILRMRNMDIRE
ncbi:hypothetical protein BDN67DRAFT_324338 [Paxillus ammoniavirescens]|nr:hypothetical protein BDN67DRAFT_324338 [Paxillus ammoniavirescens]